MSKIHQAELIIIILCLGVGFMQSQEMLWDEWDGFSTEEVPSKTHWDQLLPHALRNWVWIHVLGFVIKYVVKFCALVWAWLGGL